jgi:hypothetical protein
VPADRIESYFDNLLTAVRRSIYDSSYEKADLGKLAWPETTSVGDLAMARLLPIRQAIGQYLSGYSIESLCHGLKTVSVRHSEVTSGEGMRLMEWIRDCLGDCEQCEDCSALKAKYECYACSELEKDCSLAMEFTYEDGRFFRWRKFAEGSMGEIHAMLGKEEEKISTRMKSLGPEQTIAEALFF